MVAPEVVPKALADRVNEVILEVTAGDQMVRIIVNGVDGSDTEYRFSQQKENIYVPDERFRFTVPHGVEVMGGEMGQ